MGREMDIEKDIDDPQDGSDSFEGRSEPQRESDPTPLFRRRPSPPPIPPRRVVQAEDPYDLPPPSATEDDPFAGWTPPPPRRANVRLDEPLPQGPTQGQREVAEAGRILKSKRTKRKIGLIAGTIAAAALGITGLKYCGPDTDISEDPSDYEISADTAPEDSDDPEYQAFLRTVREEKARQQQQLEEMRKGEGQDSNAPSE